MKKSMFLLSIGCLSAGLAVAETPRKAPVESSNDATELESVEVTAQQQKKKSRSRAEQDKLPQTTESITREKAEENINSMNTEDLIKYMPSITVRKRYIGDTNAPVATRTTTMSQSARSLIYADGVILSSLLGNNNGNTGSPLWNMISPSEIERIDMMYGPFSAAYAGNSVGGVLDITTRMPDKFEASANVQSTWQDYNYLGRSTTFDAQQYSANIGDRHGDFSWRFNYSHLDSHSQPIAFATMTQSSATPAKGAVAVTGAVSDVNPYNQTIKVLGETAVNHTIQDNFKWKFAYDITPSIKASYTLGLWLNDANAKVNSFLKDGAGNSIYSGNVNIDGKGYTISPTSMIGNVVEQRRWSHGMALKSETGGLFDWSLTGSVVEYGKDIQRAPATAQNNGYSPSGGAGTNTVLTGTGWHTFDAKGIWRPKTSWGDHEVSLGYHHDLYELSNPVYNTSQWQYAGNGTIASASYGKTQTNSVWLQDILAFNRQWTLTLGGRLENWNAYDGVNKSSATQTTNQANRSALKFSPKASLKWNPDNNWQMTASIGHAYRFPTVTELFQNVRNPMTNTFSNPNPNLRPENSLSSELATQYSVEDGKIRLSFFQERTNDAIYSQTSLLANGSTLSSVQNVGQINTYGIEVSGEKQEIGRYLGIDGLDFSANGTWVDSKITKDTRIVSPNPNLPAGTLVDVVGKKQPRLPSFRANATLTYHPIKPLSISTSVRYSSQQYGQLDNSDANHYSYTGLSSFLVADTRIRYEITKQLAISGGIDNVNNEKYILYHPFPGRTYFAELKFNY
jgi:iron complex outermembrane receptor protein